LEIEGNTALLNVLQKYFRTVGRRNSWPWSTSIMPRTVCQVLRSFTTRFI